MLSLEILLSTCLVILNLNFCVCFGRCNEWNNCNGHGTCLNHDVCECFPGWGAPTDIMNTRYRAPDCSARVCPADISWGRKTKMPGVSAHPLGECSDKGKCDRKTGKCICEDGYVGAACQRRSCPNDCSGHGRCLSMMQLARTSDALPLGPNIKYTNKDYFLRNTSTKGWDADKLFACVCDSSWPVGLGYGQTQEPEWFGPDCSQRHCPSGDDPRTTKNETDCFNVQAKGSNYNGTAGNLCHVDCSNRGVCDYSSGLCSCFPGSYGGDCALTSSLAVPVDYTGYASALSSDGLPGPDGGEAFDASGSGSVGLGGASDVWAQGF